MLSELDRAIGDGITRPTCCAVFRHPEGREALAALPLASALEAMGTLLVMNVGGASGPLYGSFLLGMGRAAATAGGPPRLGKCSKRRRGSQEARPLRARQKNHAPTDGPVQLAWEQAARTVTPGGLERVKHAARRAWSHARCRPTRAAAFLLRERSIGHLIRRFLQQPAGARRLWSFLESTKH